MGLLDGILGAAGGGAAGAIGDLLGAQGGVGGILETLEKNGLGAAAASWIGKGENLPISAEQIEQVLSSGAIADLAAKLGVDPKAAAGTVAQVLPQLIDQLTPDGKAPSGGFGGLGGLGGLGDLLGKLRG